MPIIIDNAAPAITGAAAFGAGLGQGRMQLMQQWLPVARQAAAQQFEAGQTELARQSAMSMLRTKLMGETEMQRQRLAVDWNKEMEFVPAPEGEPLTEQEKRHRRQANRAAARRGMAPPYDDPDAPSRAGTWQRRPTGPQPFRPPQGTAPQALMSIPTESIPNQTSLANTGLVGDQLPSMADDFDSQYRRTLEEIQTNMGLYG